MYVGIFVYDSMQITYLFINICTVFYVDCVFVHADMYRLCDSMSIEYLFMYYMGCVIVWASLLMAYLFMQVCKFLNEVGAFI